MYFILLYNTLAGAQSVDPDHLQLARSLGLPRRQVFLRVVIPTAIPSIFVGLRLGQASIMMSAAPIRPLPNHQ